jgi:hypothetical protein
LLRVLLLSRRRLPQLDSVDRDLLLPVSRHGQPQGVNIIGVNVSIEFGPAYPSVKLSLIDEIIAEHRVGVNDYPVNRGTLGGVGS